MIEDGPFTTANVLWIERARSGPGNVPGYHVESSTYSLITAFLSGLHGIHKEVPENLGPKAVSLPNLEVVQDACLKEFGRSRNMKKAYLTAAVSTLTSLQKPLTIHQTSILQWCLTFSSPRNVSEKVPVSELGKESMEPSQTTGMRCTCCQNFQNLNVGPYLPFTTCRDGQKYAGIYLYNKEANKVSGCPAHAPSIQAVMDAIKTQSRAKGAAATWQHGDAMTIKDL